MSDAFITAWIQTVDIWTSHYWKCLDDSPFAGAYATFAGDVADMWLDWAKGLVPPIPPPSTKVAPGQKPCTTSVTVAADPAVRKLRPTAFVDGAGHAIPDSLVTLAPSIIPAGTTQSVKVSVLPCIGIPKGTYGGAIVNEAAEVVVPLVSVAIVPV